MIKIWLHNESGHEEEMEAARKDKRGWDTKANQKTSCKRQRGGTRERGVRHEGKRVGTGWVVSNLDNA